MNWQNSRKAGFNWWLRVAELPRTSWLSGWWWLSIVRRRLPNPGLPLLIPRSAVFVHASRVCLVPLGVSWVMWLPVACGRTDRHTARGKKRESCRLNVCQTEGSHLNICETEGCRLNLCQAESCRLNLCRTEGCRLNLCQTELQSKPFPDRELPSKPLSDRAVV